MQPHGPTRLPCPWGFSRQEYWSGLPCPPTGDLSNTGIKPGFPPTAGGFFTVWATMEAQHQHYLHQYRLSRYPRVSQHFWHCLFCFLHSFFITWIHNKYHPIGLSIVILPDSSNSFSTSQVEDGDFKLSLSKVNFGKSNSGSYIFRILCFKWNNQMKKNL